ncbi:hypothetical protein ACIQGZ_14300 [Streptomyces sp. NPDC092296]|uniref:hypothetical protein n=1 Tax=Streptomyces sp. NPDC092296 TaxID=3366012 RepID=UPI00382A5BF4
MPEPYDPLRAALRDAAAAGERRVVPLPAAVIRARGNRVRQRRVAAVAAAGCLLLGGTGAAVAGLLPDRTGGTAPATAPATAPSPPTSPRTAPGPPAPGLSGSHPPPPAARTGPPDPGATTTSPGYRGAPTTAPATSGLPSTSPQS